MRRRQQPIRRQFRPMTGFAMSRSDTLRVMIFAGSRMNMYREAYEH